MPLAYKALSTIYGLQDAKLYPIPVQDSFADAQSTYLHL